MRKKSSRRRIDINVDELDRIIDAAMQAPLNEADGRTLKTAVHAMAERLIRRRNTEKTSVVLEPKAPPAPVGTQQPEEQRRTRAQRRIRIYGANRVAVAHATLHSGTFARNARRKVYRQKEPATLIALWDSLRWKRPCSKWRGCAAMAVASIHAAEPPSAGAEKFDATAVAMIALLKYGTECL